MKPRLSLSRRGWLQKHAAKRPIMSRTAVTDELEKQLTDSTHD